MSNLRGLYSSKYALLFLGSIFSLLVIWVPWSELAGRGFEDRLVYLEKFSIFDSIPYVGESDGLWSFVVNESLWDILIRSLSSFLPLNFVFGFITFLSLISFSYYLLSRHELYSLLFLVNPLVIDFAFSQLRMALAMSILLIALNLRSKYLIFGVIAIAFMLHTATILIVLMYLFSLALHFRIVERRFSVKKVAALLLLFAFLVILVIGPFRGLILDAVGDRRAIYNVGASSIPYISIWLLFLIVVIFQRKKFFLSADNLMAVIGVSIFVIATFSGVPGLRFVSSIFPLVVSAILYFDKSFRPIFLIIFNMYVIVQWYFWF